MKNVNILLNEIDIQNTDDENILMCCHTYSEYILFPRKYLSNKVLDIINDNIGNNKYKEVVLKNEEKISNGKLYLKLDNISFEFITENVFVHFSINGFYNCLPIYAFNTNIKK